MTLLLVDGTTPNSFASEGSVLPRAIFADLDDRGRDGIIDAISPHLSLSERAQLYRVDPIYLGANKNWINSPIFQLRSLAGGLVLDEPNGPVLLQGLRAGTLVLDTPNGPESLSVVELSLKSKRRLSLIRQLPSALDSTHYRVEDDTSFIIQSRALDNLHLNFVNLTSVDESNRLLDQLKQVPLQKQDCNGGHESNSYCSESGPLYLVGSRAESQHPLLAKRTLLAAVGGRIYASHPSMGEVSFNVGSPEQMSQERYITEVKLSVLTTSTGEQTATGKAPVESYELLSKLVKQASQVWGACGVDVKIAEKEGFKLAPTPAGSLLVIGCEGRSKSQGGQLALKVADEDIIVRTQRNEGPQVVALNLSLALKRAGFSVKRYTTPLVASEADSVVDILVKGPRGDWLEIRPLNDTVSNDPGLGACISNVDLSDGLHHFRDSTSARGTREERSLIRQLQDDDPATIEVIVIPEFAGAGRIGESFLDRFGSSIENIIILDRAGLRASTRSMTLAHELGHLLLDMPGHPDDFGVDRPAQLMDADASDASIFGPRRLSLAQCQRALLQSGPGGLNELIKAHPFTQDE